jgi:hypothetical protein
MEVPPKKAKHTNGLAIYAKKRSKVIKIFENKIELDEFKSIHGKDDSIIYLARQHTKHAWKYEAWNFDMFCDFYINDITESDRLYHDVIDPNDPCRLHFDLDYEGTDEMKFLSKVNELELAVKEFLSSHFGTCMERPPIKWTCSRPGKFSMHLVYDQVWFSTGIQCVHAVKEILKICPPEDIIDEKIYSMRTRKNFRLPYSIKLDKRNDDKSSPPFIPFGGLNGDKIDVDLLLRSFLTYRNTKRTGYFSQRIEPLPTTLLCTQNTPTLLPFIVKQTFEYHNNGDIKRWVEDHFDAKRIYDRTENGRIALIIVPGIVCPMKRDRHTSNNTLFHCCSSTTAYFFCPDCRVSWKLWYNLKFLGGNQSYPSLETFDEQYSLYQSALESSLVE